MATTRTPNRRPTTNRRAPARPKPRVITDPEPEMDEIVTSPKVDSKPREVIIDGTRYTPAGTTDTGLPKVAIAVTTHDRNELLERVLTSIRDHTPAEFPIFIVDDASEKPVDGADYRFEENVGVAPAKNKCLELIMGRTDAEHMFLLDDDVLIKANDWWRSYVESPEPHLAHSWNLVKLWSDDQHVAWHASGGTVLYYTRAVIDDVGGMRTDFSDPIGPAWGCEHVNLSDRIHNRGWTTWRYADVAGAEMLFTEYDRDRTRNGHKSTATDRQREYNAGPGRELWMQRIETDDEYVEYRTDADVILTCLFTNKQAQLSGRRLKPTLEPLRDLAESIQHGRLVVFYDRLENPEMTTGNGLPVEFVPADCKINVFFARWQVYWQWLRDHPEIARVWAVDGTDVQQLRDPFTELGRGKLHMGWEPGTLESPWLREHHPNRRAQEFMINNRHRQILNPGVVGGDRQTVMAFAHAMISHFYEVAIDHAQVWESRDKAKVGAGDVVAANIAAYTRFADRLVTGSAVTSVFKAYEEDWSSRGWAPMWAHK